MHPHMYPHMHPHIIPRTCTRTWSVPRELTRLALAQRLLQPVGSHVVGVVPAVFARQRHDE
ncbi:hypothetical protein EYF80_065645 [Liparis tanakae]|uniref:Uncharacterized protein n=1 Tax=Liparis tanakae TaxID=230148 RepID=A0A4Z2E7D5_9TELE|nr:hypothetical protein EYF80_065645 [Liparis tanakae]